MEKKLSVLFVCLVLISMDDALAWNERGHHIICEVATRLVKDPDLKKFLQTRGQTMGHLCNVPDIYWREMGDMSKPGDAAHFIRPEVVGGTPKDVPIRLGAYFSLKQSNDTPEDKADELGTLWWRAEQFFNLAVKEASDVRSTTLPTASTQQDSSYAYNKHVYNFMVNLGLMGHFIGDAAMPFHNTKDYDGWETGHGGIHSFYESNCVSFYPLDLVVKVRNEAQNLVNKFIKPGTFNEWIKRVSVASASEKTEVESLDTIIEPSRESSKKAAVRHSNEVACPKFENLIVKQLARAATTLAASWERAYKEGVRPNLAGYHLRKYPLKPDYIPLDYIDKSLMLNRSFSLNFNFQ